MTNRPLLSIALLFLFIGWNTFTANAQQRMSWAAGIGLTQYGGDVNEGQMGTHRAALNVEGWYPLTDRWQLKSGFSVYGLRGQDTDPSRARSFRARNVELYSSALYYFRRGYLTPFAYAGLGITTSRPRGESQLGLWDLRDVQPEGQRVPGLLAMVPFGVGLEYEINPMLSVVVDAAARYVLSDQLDAVSQETVNREALSPLAVDYYQSLSDPVTRRLAENEPLVGGNSATNDWYGILSVKIKFTPFTGCLNPHRYSRPQGRRRGGRNYRPS
ncbi:MAG: hypothetical protein WA958_16340 [Tunicatimonas sp.]